MGLEKTKNSLYFSLLTGKSERGSQQTASTATLSLFFIKGFCI